MPYRLFTAALVGVALVLVASLAWAQSTWTLTSDPLDPAATSVVVSFDGIDDPTCGPTAAPCIGADGAIEFDITDRIASGVPFTVSARACNQFQCSPDSAPLDIDPRLPLEPQGLQVIEVAP